MNGNITVGFVDGRVRSRILKPPGGGYSDILFTQCENTPPKASPPSRCETAVESIMKNENELKEDQTNVEIFGEELKEDQKSVEMFGDEFKDVQTISIEKEEGKMFEEKSTVVGQTLLSNDTFRSSESR
jgi:hypothetical protein